MTICDRCVYKHTELCNDCYDHPIIKQVLNSLPKQSYFQFYQPACPYGIADCINDPGYIKVFYPEDYAEEYGDKDPEEVIKENGCLKNYREDSEFCLYYDNEDK